MPPPNAQAVLGRGPSNLQGEQLVACFSIAPLRKSTSHFTDDPKAFAAYVNAEYEKWGKVVRDVKLQIN